MIARLRARLNRIDREYFAIGWTVLMLGALNQINLGLGVLP